ncbi:uncharacterized protein V6R79_014812 [Siganus canaliculatus]
MRGLTLLCLMGFILMLVPATTSEIKAYVKRPLNKVTNSTTNSTTNATETEGGSVLLLNQQESKPTKKPWYTGIRTILGTNRTFPTGHADVNETQIKAYRKRPLNKVTNSTTNSTTNATETEGGSVLLPNQQDSKPKTKPWFTGVVTILDTYRDFPTGHTDANETQAKEN